MSTFHGLAFSKAHVLASLHRECLLRFLEPHRAYLERRRVRWDQLALTETTEAFDDLVEVLMEPERRTPNDLVDGLFIIDELSNLDIEDELQQLTASVGIEVAEDWSQTDHLLVLWTVAAAQLRDLHLQQSTLRPRSFEYFMADATLQEENNLPTDSQLRMMETAADVWFSQKHCGTGTRIHMTVRGCEWWFLVRHGERMTRFSAVDVDGGRSLHCFRPEKFDLLVFNTNTEELRINAPSTGRRQFYRRTIGTYIFGRENHFPGVNKYSLQPLVDEGRDALVCSDVPRLFGAELTALKFTFTEDPRSRVLNYSGEDLFDLMDSDLCSFPVNAKLLQATFKLRIADCERPRSVTIKPPNVAQYVRDNDSTILEEWLQARKFNTSERNNNNAQRELHLGMD